ncbi:MAG: hypothetical protein WAT70_12130 [Rhizobiaceae bacterium]
MIIITLGEPGIAVLVQHRLSVDPEIRRLLDIAARVVAQGDAGIAVLMQHRLSVDAEKVERERISVRIAVRFLSRTEIAVPDQLAGRT